MNKRKKNKLYIILSFALLCLLFVPTRTTYAYFVDSVSVDSGIELTLGTVDLSLLDAGNLENKNPIKIGKENPVANVKETVQNTGTLSGKLAYKINLTKSDGTPLSNELQQSIRLKLNDTDAKINSEYTIVTSTEGVPLSLTPTQSADIFIKLEVASLPKKTENIKVEIEFLLFQTNGSIDMPLFHDVESVSYIFEVEKKEEEVTPPAEENDDEYWPPTGWVDKGNILYNLEDYNPVMYYSEMVGSKKIKNLNDVIIYVKTKDPKGIETITSKDLTIQSPPGIFIKAKYVNENKHHLKLTFSIDENSFTRNPLSVSMGYYRVASNGPNASFELNSDGLPITLKRILLSTDDRVKNNFSVQPIYLFGETRKINFAYTNDTDNYIEENLEKLSFNDQVKVSVSASGDNEGFVQTGEYSIGDKNFILTPLTTTDVKKTDINLIVQLKGSSGKTLEVKREVLLMPTFSKDYWPKDIPDKRWVIQDIDGKYTEQPTLFLQEVDRKYVSNDINIYVKNTNKEDLQFSVSNPEKFVVQKITYSANREYMKVTLKYISLISDYSRPYGFNFNVTGENGAGIINGSYVPINEVLK